MTVLHGVNEANKSQDLLHQPGLEHASTCMPDQRTACTATQGIVGDSDSQVEDSDSQVGDSDLSYWDLYKFATMKYKLYNFYYKDHKVCAVIAHRYTYSPPRCRNSQYHMTFIPLSGSLWNDLVDPVFDGVGLAGFKSRSNAFLLA